MVSGHQTAQILRRQLVTMVCIPFVVVTMELSQKLQMSERRFSTLCVIVKWRDYHCGANLAETIARLQKRFHPAHPSEPDTTTNRFVKWQPLFQARTQFRRQLKTHLFM